MRYLISIVILISCKPISRTDHNVVKETDSQKLSVKLLPYEEGSVLIACYQEQCQNLLLDKDSKEVSPYVFFNPDSIPLEVAGEKEKKSALKKGLAIGGAVVMGALALVGVKRLHTLSDQMDKVKWLQWKHANEGALVPGQKLTDLPDDPHRMLRPNSPLTTRESEVVDQVITSRNQRKLDRHSPTHGGAKMRLPYHSGDNPLLFDMTQLQTLEKAVYRMIEGDRGMTRVLAEGNYNRFTGTWKVDPSKEELWFLESTKRTLSYADEDLQRVFHASEVAKQEWTPVVIGLLAFIPLTLVTNFSLDVMNDRKLKAQSENIYSLFSERKPILLTFDELKRLLRVFSMYIPTKIDKNSIKELSASMS